MSTDAGRDNPHVAAADEFDQRDGLTKEQRAEREERTTAILYELRRLAAELVALDQQTGRAATLGDSERLCDAAEELITRHVRFAELYREFLVNRVRGPRPGRLFPVRMERSSW